MSCRIVPRQVLALLVCAAMILAAAGPALAYPSDVRCDGLTIRPLAPAYAPGQAVSLEVTGSAGSGPVTAIAVYYAPAASDLTLTGARRVVFIFRNLQDGSYQLRIDGANAIAIKVSGNTAVHVSDAWQGRHVLTID